MNDERFLKDWLRDTTESTSDPSAAADKVVSRIPDTPQRRRWLPWPPARRRKPTDHNGRTQFMLSPVKTLAGVAIAAIIATSFLVARPFETGPGSAPLGAELDPSQAAVITGTIADLGSPSNTSGTREVTDGIVRTKGIHYMNVWETSDPRLSGTATYDAAWIAFPAEDLQVEAARHVLENADGRWVGSGSTLANSGVIDENTDIAILRGEGAYEGLTAYVQMDWTSLPATIEAAIFPGEMPVVEPLID